MIRAPVQCLGFCLASIARLLPPVGIVRPEWRADRRLPKASRALQQQQQQFGSSAAAATGGGELCESSSSAPTVEPLPFHRPQWDRDRRPRRREVIARNLLLVKCSLLLLSVQSWLEPAGKGPEPVVGEEEEEGNVLRCSCCTPDHHLLASLLCCWTTPRHQLNPTRLKHQIISANLPTRLKHPHQAKPVGATSRRHRSHLGEESHSEEETKVISLPQSSSISFTIPPIFSTNAKKISPWAFFPNHFVLCTLHIIGST